MTPGTPDGEDRRLEAELRAVAEAKSRGLADHPFAQELVDYHLGVLASEEADAIQEHLSFCQECSQIVLDLVAFSRPPAGVPAKPAADLDREWDRLQARLEREAAKTGTGSATFRAFSWALAASLLLTLGLLGWNLRLREGLKATRLPRTDIAMANLAPEKPGAERSTEMPALVRVRPNQQWVLLLLNLGDLRQFADYRLELIDPEKGVLWAQSGVLRSDDGTFLLDIPAHLLKTKLYEVHLHGKLDGKSIPLAEYSFEVVQGDLSVR